MKTCGAEVDSSGNLVLENNKAKLSDENLEKFEIEFKKILKEEVELPFAPLPYERTSEIKEPVEMYKTSFLNKLFGEYK